MHNHTDCLRSHYANVTANYKTESSGTSFFEMSWVVRSKVRKRCKL